MFQKLIPNVIRSYHFQTLMETSTKLNIKIPSFNPLAYVPIDKLIEQFKDEIVVLGIDDDKKPIGVIYPIKTILSDKSSLRALITTLNRTELLKSFAIEHSPACEDVLVCVAHLRSVEFNSFNFDLDTVIDEVLIKVRTLNQFCVERETNYANILGPLVGWMKQRTDAHYLKWNFGHSEEWNLIYDEQEKKVDADLAHIKHQMVDEPEKANDLVRALIMKMGIRVYPPANMLDNNRLSKIVEIFELVSPICTEFARKFMVDVISSVVGCSLLSSLSKFEGRIVIDDWCKLGVDMCKLCVDENETFSGQIHKHRKGCSVQTIMPKPNALKASLLMLIHEEQRMIAPLIKTSKGKVHLTGEESFIFDIDSAQMLAENLYSLKKSLEYFRHYVGPSFDDLDLSHSFITGSAIPACCVKNKREWESVQHDKFIDIFYPANYTPIQSKFDKSKLQSALQNGQMTIEIDTKNRSGKLYPTTKNPNDEILHFTLEDGADVDIAVDDTLPVEKFDEIVAQHFKTILKHHPEAKMERIVREKGHMYDITTSYRKFQIYPASIAHIMTHHVGPVRGYVTDVDKQRTIKLSATAVMSVVTHQSYNYYYFAGKKSSPLDIMFKYKMRGFCPPNRFDRILDKYLKSSYHDSRFNPAYNLIKYYDLSAVNHTPSGTFGNTVIIDDVAVKNIPSTTTRRRIIPQMQLVSRVLPSVSRVANNNNESSDEENPKDEQDE